jgi:hypothetical protein
VLPIVRCFGIVWGVYRGCVMTKPAVVLIGADKGGVGKTMVARTLLDYFAHQQVRARAFDTEVPRGTLKRFHPDVTDVVDINYVPDQMRIFDTVNSTDVSVSLIDVRAGLLSPTLRALRNIGFIDAAKKGHITFVVFHILGPTLASLDEIAETAAYLGDAKYLMVKNFISNTHFFEWDETTYVSYFKRVPDAVEITIPKLTERATEQIELGSVRDLHSQREAERGPRLLFIRAARLCPSLARQCLGGVQPRRPHRHCASNGTPKPPVGRPRPVVNAAVRRTSLAARREEPAAGRKVAY